MNSVFRIRVTTVIQNILIHSHFTNYCFHTQQLLLTKAQPENWEGPKIRNQKQIIAVFQPWKPWSPLRPVFSETSGWSPLSAFLACQLFFRSHAEPRRHTVLFWTWKAVLFYTKLSSTVTNSQWLHICTFQSSINSNNFHLLQGAIARRDSCTLLLSICFSLHYYHRTMVSTTIEGHSLHMQSAFSRHIRKFKHCSFFLSTFHIFLYLPSFLPASFQLQHE